VNELPETAATIFLAAIKAIDPEECVKRRLQRSSTDLLIGVASEWGTHGLPDSFS
jgi:hypothetical protein